MDQFRYRKNQREVLGAGNYSVDHDGSRHVMYTGLYQGDKIVALLVGADGDAKAENIDAVGDLITRACNAHDGLVTALRFYADQTEYAKFSQAERSNYGDTSKLGEDRGEVARAALAAAGAA